MSEDRCRCGHPSKSTDPHPCHANGYTCRRHAKQRFYPAMLASLAGVQMKIAVHESWACDECWAEFQKRGE